jgi:transcription-repair coupling factor (superfamily II helicase)
VALGIDKIDIGEQSGKIVFNRNPNINPLKIIELIQASPDRYRLDGKQTLRITCQNVELEPRFKQVENLLKKLTTE